jgi:hypothetical protein
MTQEDILKISGPGPILEKEREVIFWPLLFFKDKGIEGRLSRMGQTPDMPFS